VHLLDSLEQVLDMNPDLSLDELNILIQHKTMQHNNQPKAEFCGLSSSQVAKWMNAPFNELKLVTICTPDDLSGTPVMRYLALILDEAMQQDGSFKATAKGSLPAELVKKASELLPEFDVAAFFLPMLKAATTKFIWNYMDWFDDDVDLRPFWLFMLWRLQSHDSIDQMIEEMCVAFPILLRQFPTNKYYTPEEYLGICIEARFIKRFLECWGFVTINPRRFSGNEPLSGKVSKQPLLKQTFHFTVK